MWLQARSHEEMLKKAKEPSPYDVPKFTLPPLTEVKAEAVSRMFTCQWKWRYVRWCVIKACCSIAVHSLLACDSPYMCLRDQELHIRRWSEGL